MKRTPPRTAGFDMTEWELQTVLTRQWATNGVSLGDDGPLFLAAREVMTNWHMNDAHKRFDKPSPDFLALGERGCLVAIELKVNVIKPGDAWRALCQVTHRAQMLGASYQPVRLARVRRECGFGDHAIGASEPEELRERAYPAFNAKSHFRYVGFDRHLHRHARATRARMSS